MAFVSQHEPLFLPPDGFSERRRAASLLLIRTMSLIIVTLFGAPRAAFAAATTRRPDTRQPIVWIDAKKHAAPNACRPGFVTLSVPIKTVYQAERLKISVNLRPARSGDVPTLCLTAVFTASRLGVNRIDQFRISRRRLESVVDIADELTVTALSDITTDGVLTFVFRVDGATGSVAVTMVVQYGDDTVAQFSGMIAGNNRVPGKNVSALSGCPPAMDLTRAGPAGITSAPITLDEGIHGMYFWYRLPRTGFASSRRTQRPSIHIEWTPATSVGGDGQTVFSGVLRPAYPDGWGRQTILFETPARGRIVVRMNGSGCILDAHIDLPTVRPIPNHLLWYASRGTETFKKPGRHSVSWLVKRAVSSGSPSADAMLAALQSDGIFHDEKITITVYDLTALADRTAFQTAAGLQAPPASDRGAFAIRSTRTAARIAAGDPLSMAAAFNVLSQLVVKNGDVSWFLSAEIVDEAASSGRMAAVTPSIALTLMTDPMRLLDFAARTGATHILVPAFIGSDPRFQWGGRSWMDAKQRCDALGLIWAPDLFPNDVARLVLPADPAAVRCRLTHETIVMRGTEWSRLSAGDIIYPGRSLHASLQSGRRVSIGGDVIAVASRLKWPLTSEHDIWVRRAESGAVGDGEPVVWSYSRLMEPNLEPDWPLTLASGKARVGLARALRLTSQAVGDELICVTPGYALPKTLDPLERAAPYRIDRLWAEWLNTIAAQLSKRDRAPRLLLKSAVMNGSRAPDGLPAFSRTIRNWLNADAVMMWEPVLTPRAVRDIRISSPGVLSGDAVSPGGGHYWIWVSDDVPGASSQAVRKPQPGRIADAEQLLRNLRSLW